MIKIKYSFSLVLLLALLSSCSSGSRNATFENPNTKSLPNTALYKKEARPGDIISNTRGQNRIQGSSDLSETDSSGKKVYFLYGAEHLKLENYYFDIPVVYNDSVKKWMNYFLNKGKDYFIRYSERAGRYAPILGKILDDHGLPRDLIFLAMAESGFQNNAKSWARAVGPWQFMSYTGKKYGLNRSWYFDERRDPLKSTIAAAKYLKALYEIFGSWELAAAGYNAGEGKVARAIRRYDTENFWDIRQGRYLKSETKNYVPKIMALAIIGKNLNAFGFDDIDFHEPLDFDEVDVPGNTDLYAVAKALDMPFEDLQYLNPELLRWVTPPDVESYKLRLPTGLGSKWRSCCDGIDLAAKDFQAFTPKTPMTLSQVAKKFRLAPEVLSVLNSSMRPDDRIGRDQAIRLPFHTGHNVKDIMYSDLYELPPRRLRARNNYKARIRQAMAKGTMIKDPKEFYVVQKGDTLWHVSRKTGVSIDTLIRTNITLISNRQIRQGDKLVIR